FAAVVIRQHEALHALGARAREVEREQRGARDVALFLANVRRNDGALFVRGVLLHGARDALRRAAREGLVLTRRSVFCGGSAHEREAEEGERTSQRAIHRPRSTTWLRHAQSRAFPRAPAGGRAAR